MKLFAVAMAVALALLVATPASLASASHHGREGTTHYAYAAKGKACRKRHRKRVCRHTPPRTQPGTPPPAGPPPVTPTAPAAPPSPPASSAATQFASALVGTTYERYTSSSSGSDFTDDYTFCANGTFLEHTESYAAGTYVVGDYNGTWTVTDALSATSADVAYTTTNPNLPSSGTVLITLIPNGIYVGTNDYSVKGPASC